MSNKVFQALCHILDAVWILFPVWFFVYKQSAAEMTYRQGDDISTLKENAMLGLIVAQERTQARDGKGMILPLQ